MSIATAVPSRKKTGTEGQRWPGKHTEDNLRTQLIRRLGIGWHFQRHEDRISTGIADLSYASEGVDGWIELKVCKNGPPLKNLKAHQKGWLTRRGSLGRGRVFVIVWVRDKMSDRLVCYRWSDLKGGVPSNTVECNLEHNTFVARMEQMLRGF